MGWGLELLDGDGFGEVLGFVDIATAKNGGVVGQSLQRDDGEEGL